MGTRVCSHPQVHTCPGYTPHLTQWSIATLLQYHALNSNRTSFCHGQLSGLTRPRKCELIEGQGPSCPKCPGINSTVQCTQQVPHLARCDSPQPPKSLCRSPNPAGYDLIWKAGHCTCNYSRRSLTRAGGQRSNTFGVLVKKKKKRAIWTQAHIHTHREEHVETKAETRGCFHEQGKPKTADTWQALGKGQSQILLGALGGNNATNSFVSDFELPELGDDTSLLVRWPSLRSSATTAVGDGRGRFASEGRKDGVKESQFHSTQCSLTGFLLVLWEKGGRSRGRELGWMRTVYGGRLGSGSRSSPPTSTHTLPFPVCGSLSPVPARIQFPEPIFSTLLTLA